MAMNPTLNARLDTRDGVATAFAGRDVERLVGGWQQTHLRSVLTGSAGVVVLVGGYGLYVPHVGTSPAVLDHRVWVHGVRTSTAKVAGVSARVTPPPVSQLSSADQAREVLAALSLNKTQLAEVLGVTRPTLYQWLDGQEPNPANAQRLSTVARLLRNAGVTSASPLFSRFVRQPLEDGATTLLDLLKADVLDEQELSRLVREAKVLGDAAEERRLSRERQLAARGFDEPSSEQRREQLARNVALRDWPKE